MRIAIAGMHNEASGFSLHTADAAFFRWDRGAALLAGYDFAADLGADAVADVTFVPVLVAMGGASGPVEPAVFDAVVDEIRVGLVAAQADAPLDGVYLHMHGAVGVRGREGAEEVLVTAVRAIVGPGCVIGMSMDPHGNLSRELIGLVDIACVHRHSPHVDNHATPGRTVGHMLRAIRTGVRPSVAWVRIPSLLPGERTSTVVEPGRSVFGRVASAITEHGVDDAGIWVGFAWADEPRNAAAAVAFGPDAHAARACAEELARGYWDAREDFAIVSEHAGTWSEALDHLLTGPPAPLFISDSGDNVTAGAAGDVTYALAETLLRDDVLASGKRILFTGLHDPDAVAAACDAGVGAWLDIAIGAHLDARYAGPVPGPWEVAAIVDGMQGEGIVGAVLRHSSIDVIVQTTRQRFVAASDPSASANGSPNAAIVDVTGYDAVVVKNGYLFPTQVDAAGSAFMAITPGGTDLDPDRLVFTRRAVPLFPFERAFDPDLTAAIVAGPAS